MQKFGEPNPIFIHEENAILSEVHKAREAHHSSVIGKNGELPLLDLLNRYLPNTLTAKSGFFYDPVSGTRSPQIDIMILDARFPHLATYQDGTVIAFAHAVVRAIEVKTKLSKKDIDTFRANAKSISNLMTNIFEKDGWSDASITCFAYEAATHFETAAKNFFSKPFECYCDMVLLRASFDKQNAGLMPEIIGANLWYENGGEEVDPQECLLYTHSPLSDLYYRIVQDSYYTLSSRGFSFAEIGQLFNSYMTWGTHRPGS